MKYPAYSKYKDSGVQWLGDVPEHWEVKRIGFVSKKIGSGKTPLGGAETYQKDGVLFLRSQNIYDNGLRLEDVVCIDDETDQMLASSRVSPCDILLNITGASLGRTCIVPSPFPRANVNQHVCIIRLNIRNQSSFISWSMKSSVAKAQIQNSQTGAAREGLGFDEIAKICFVLPPPAEQKAIAEFLDRETGRIDLLVAKKRELVERLKEKRAALISRTVTKGLPADAAKEFGLEPHTAFKPSGIDWLGDIPERWEVKEIKWESAVQRGASPRPIDDPIYFDDDGEYAWVRIADVTAAGMYLESTKQRLSDLGSSLSVRMQPGSLFLSIAGTVGKPCITNIKCCIHDGFVYFPKWKNDTKFLFYIFESGEPYKGLGKMGTQLNLNTDTVGSIIIGLPSPEEQIAIVGYLDRETAKLDRLAEKVEEAIERLQEYRAALITAAVTGKIKVDVIEPNRSNLSCRVADELQDVD